jgi:hypothetical protein
MMRVKHIIESHRVQDSGGIVRGGDGANPFFMFIAPR